MQGSLGKSGSAGETNRQGTPTLGSDRQPFGRMTAYLLRSCHTATMSASLAMSLTCSVPTIVYSDMLASCCFMMCNNQRWFSPGNVQLRKTAADDVGNAHT